MSKPTLEQISVRLRPPLNLPLGKEQVQAAPGDQEAQIVVTLEQLRPYDRNPRFIRNPLYNDIKASIRERGLEQAFSITRRPGELNFVILSGGNTRLAILNELWQETREERFFRLSCRYQPWRSEAYAVLGHLAESDLHGKLAFIERALAVIGVKELLETDRTPMTQRELAQTLSAKGYPVSQSQISRMFETVQHLYPSLPQALSSGLTRTDIERLLQLRRRVELAWNRRLVPSDELASVWQQALFNHDTAAAEFDWEEVRPALVAQLASALGISPRLMELEVAQDGAPLQPIADQPESVETSKPSVEVPLSTLPEPAAALESLAQAPPSHVADVRDERHDTDIEVLSPTAEHPQRDESPLSAAVNDQPAHDLPSLFSLLDAVASLSSDQLRQRIIQHAQALADSVGISDFIAPSDDDVGFVLDWETAGAAHDQAVAVQLLLSGLIGAEADLDPALQKAFPVTVIRQLLAGWPAKRGAALAEVKALSDIQLQLFTHLLVLIRRLLELDRPTPF